MTSEDICGSENKRQRDMDRMHGGVTNFLLYSVQYVYSVRNVMICTPRSTYSNSRAWIVDCMYSVHMYSTPRAGSDGSPARPSSQAGVRAVRASAKNILDIRAVLFRTGSCGRKRGPGVCSTGVPSRHCSVRSMYNRGMYLRYSVLRLL